MFVSKNQNLLLKLLGYGYGQIVPEGFRPVTVTTIEAAGRLLDSALKQGIMNEEDVATAKQQMLDIGMAANFGQICTAISEYTADEGFEPSFKFVAHEGCPYPLPHGMLVNKDGAHVSEPIHSLEDGLCLVLEMADSEQFHVLDCIDAFKQMVAMDLPVDEAEIRQLLEALPPENNDATTKPRLDAMVDMLADALGLNVTIVEIQFPRRAANKPSDNTGMPGQPPSNQQA